VSDVGTRVAERLGAYSYMYATERDLLLQAVKVLGADFPEAAIRWEVRLGSQADRIDLLAEFSEARIGIEVKIDGSAQAVRRQLERYAKTGRVDELILFTTKASHERELNRNWALAEPRGGRPGCPLRVVRVRWL
jgi:hypothetical protein